MDQDGDRPMFRPDLLHMDILPIDIVEILHGCSLAPTLYELALSL
jgi:hypothetical protein